MATKVTMSGYIWNLSQARYRRKVTTNKKSRLVWAAPGVFKKLLGRFLGAAHVLSLQPLGSLLDFELYLRAFIQSPISIGLDGREMHEHIVATGALDKSITLGGIKPLHYAFFFHF